MLSHNRTKKGIALTKHIGSVESYFIVWAQFVSSEGRIFGIGSFQQKEQIRRGNWSETLERRIRARHEQGDGWRDY